MQGKIGILQGDITKLAVDAIVNAANSSLLGGGGVDGAIHRAAGPDLVQECRLLHGCKTGKAKITKGYNLPAKFVIHTVGPVWRGGFAGEPELLASCYRESLKLAIENNITTIAFPAISCGVYGYPVEQAAIVAVQTVAEFLASEAGNEIAGVSFVCFDDAAYDAYLEAFGMI
jgi:O-acetyl-ADP-ribose deacetylase